MGIMLRRCFGGNSGEGAGIRVAVWPCGREVLADDRESREAVVGAGAERAGRNVGVRAVG
jgi:hypothetical protein